MSITWDLLVQGKLCRNFGGTCIYIYKKKNLPEIFQYIAKKNVEKFGAVTGGLGWFGRNGPCLEPDLFYGSLPLVDSTQGTDLATFPHKLFVPYAVEKTRHMPTFFSIATGLLYSGIELRAGLESIGLCLHFPVPSKV